MHAWSGTTDASACVSAAGVRIENGCAWGQIEDELLMKSDDDSPVIGSVLPHLVCSRLNGYRCSFDSLYVCRVA